MGFRINPSGRYTLIGSKEEKLIDEGDESRTTEDSPGIDVISQNRCRTRKWRRNRRDALVVAIKEGSQMAECYSPRRTSLRSFLGFIRK